MEKVAGLCLRDLNRLAVKEVAHYFLFSFTDGSGVQHTVVMHPA